jgi:hypothetical protein
MSGKVGARIGPELEIPPFRPQQNRPAGSAEAFVPQGLSATDLGARAARRQRQRADEFFASDPQDE